ncbi:hypothetical protein [Salegentibacter tibetensis]|nr:hypothetical protein [Salegentibacter tibetensis]
MKYEDCIILFSAKDKEEDRSDENKKATKSKNNIPEFVATF